jgi:cytohesin
LITLLVDHGADVNAHGMMEYTLLHQAVLDSDLDRAALLLAKGADVNAKGQQKRTPLHLAAEKGDVAMVNLLLDHGADTKIEYQYSAVNNVWSGPNALMDAADNNRIEVVKVLLERGADPNAVEGGGQFGMTAMARARDHNLTAIVDLLKAHGATR